MDDGAPVRLLSRAEAEALVRRTVAQDAASLLRVAHRYTGNPHDAQDAYQRTLEILVRRAPQLDPQRARQWVHTVCKHEAITIVRRRGGERATGLSEVEHLPAPDGSPEDRVLDAERVHRTAEALARLKPQEVEALWHRALGKSYNDIADELGWTYTKVNRCVTEGRRALLERCASIESGAECERWAPVLAAMVDGEATERQLRDVRPHLRACGACKATVRELHLSAASLGVLLPPAVLAGEERAPGGGLLTRLAESVAGFFGEKATASALKIQAFTEAATGSKLAAVAASTVAVGGGAVAVEQSARPHRAPERPAAHSAPVRAAATTPGTGTAAPAGPVRAAAASVPAAARPATARSAIARRRLAQARGGRAGEFAAPAAGRPARAGEFAPRAGTATATEPAVPVAAADPQARREFAPAPQPAPAPQAAAAPRAAPAPVAAGEFGR